MARKTKAQLLEELGALRARLEQLQRERGAPAVERVVAALEAALRPAVGADYLQGLVVELTRALGARLAFVGRLAGGGANEVEAVAVAERGEPAPPFTYALAGTPCENVVDRSTCCYPTGVARLFPEDPLLRTLGAESYAGTPLFSGSGDPLGLLAVVHDAPMAEPELATAVLEVFAVRVAAELERRRLDAAVRRSKELFEKVFRLIPDCVALTTLDEGRIVAVNDAVLPLARYAPEEVVGRSAVELFWESPAVRESFADGLRREGRVRHFETRLRVRSGELRDVVMVAELLEFDGEQFVLTVVRDVTEVKRADRMLRESEQRYRSLVENAVFGIYRSTPDGRLLQVNPALVAMLGYDSAEELRAVNAADLFLDPEERRRLVERYREAGAIAGLEARWKRKDGTAITVRLAGRPVRGPTGELEGFEMTVEDVTERRQLEEQLRQAQRMEALARLAGGVAHDVNNLLTAIAGCAELLRDSLPDGDPRRPDVEEILAATQRGGTLTRQLLAIGRQAVGAPQPLDLNAVVLGLERMLRRVLGEDVEWVTELRATGRIWMDPVHVEQVLMNLVVNARDAMPEGGRLEVRTEDVVLDEAYVARHNEVEPGPYVLLAVSDTGVGMDRETREHAFEPFFTTKEPGRGTGLGLATVYGIVRQAGGQIWLYSEPGLGTTVKIYWPRTETGREAAPPARARPGPARGRGEAVLLVEDDAAVRRAVERALVAGGYRVHAVEDVASAVAALRDPEVPVDLVLTDLVLSGGSGRDLRAEAERARPGVPVLYMSGYARDLATGRRLVEPGEFVLEKPFGMEELLVVLRDALDRPR